MKSTRLAGMLLVGSGFLCTALTGSAQTLPIPAVYAITNARIEVGDGRVIEKGNVIIRDGIIEAVGPNARVPAEAEVVKGDGLTVYPGFIDAYTTVGTKLPDAEPNQDTPPDISTTVLTAMREADRKGVRADLKAVDYLALTDASLGPIRQTGFTTEMIAPPDGLIDGFGGLVNLSGQPRRDCVVKPRVGMSFGFTTGGRGAAGYPASLLGGIAQIRQTLLDAQRFHLQTVAFAGGNAGRPPADEVLISLQPVLDNTLPALFNANTENEIVRSLRIADEFHLQPILSGGLYAFKQTALLASRKVPVLVSLNFGSEPGVTKPAGRGGRPPSGSRGAGGGRGGRPGGGNAEIPSPDDFAAPPAPVTPPATPPEPDDMPKAELAERKRLWAEKVANASKLNEAGILFAFCTRDIRNVSDFWDNLRAAIKAGLPRAAALRGLTVNAARIFGVEKQMGTVEAGKIAAITVASGDIFDAKTKVKFLFIDTKKFDPENDKPAGPPARPPFPPAEIELPE